MKWLEKKMMQKIARSTIQAWLLFVAILILGAHYNVACAAQDNPKKTRTAVACGKEIKKQCSRVFPTEPKKTFRKVRCFGQ
jgi:hypothetical protein